MSPLHIIARNDIAWHACMYGRQVDQVRRNMREARRCREEGQSPAMWLRWAREDATAARKNLQALLSRIDNHERRAA